MTSHGKGGARLATDMHNYYVESTPISVATFTYLVHVEQQQTVVERADCFL